MLCRVLAFALSFAPLSLASEFRPVQREGEKTVLTNSTTRLYCFQPIREFTYWEKNEEKINMSQRVGVYASGSYIILLVQKSQISDAGEYLCRSNSSKKILNQIVLHVRERWRVKALSHYVTAQIGTQVKLKCSVSLPRSSDRRDEGFILWFRAHNHLIRHNDRLRIFSTASGSTLTITSVTITDAGYFHCRGGGLQNLNESGDSIRLEVYLPPTNVRISPSLKEVYSGSTVYFACLADAYPLPNITWIKTGTRETVVGTGSQLTLFNVTARQAERLICRCANKFGKVAAQAMLYVHDKAEKIVNRVDKSILLPVSLPFVQSKLKQKTFYTAYRNRKRLILDFPGEIVKKGRRDKFYFELPHSRFTGLLNFTIMVHSKESKDVLQESTKIFEIFGPPPKVEQVEANYDCHALEIKLEMPLNNTYRPWSHVYLQLRQYSSFLKKSRIFFSLNTTNTSLLMNSVSICHKNALIVVETEVIGKYGESRPTLLTPSLTKASDFNPSDFVDVPGALYFPRTEVVITSNLSTCGSFLDVQPYTHHLLIMDQLIQTAAANQIIIERGGVLSNSAFILTMNFGDLTFTDAAAKFTILRRLINTKRANIGSCQVTVNFSCTFAADGQPLPFTCKQYFVISSPSSNSNGLICCNFIVIILACFTNLL